jgi:putative membrane protein
MGILLRWVAGAAALFITVQLAKFLGIKTLALEGGNGGIPAAFVVILALTLVNAFIRPIVVLLTLPLNCLTLGFFSFVVNALMFWLVGQFDLGLKVEGLFAPLFGSVVLSIVSGLLNNFISAGEKK